MHRLTTGLFQLSVVLLASIVVSGCDSLLGGAGESDGTDTTSPDFSGIESLSTGLGVAKLSWSAATDNETDSSNIIYEIYTSESDSLEPGGSPTATTQAGATSAEVQVPSFTEQYFLVQAVDEAGNRDGNATVKSAATDDALWSFIDGAQRDGATGGIQVGSNPGPPALESLDGQVYAAWIDGIDDRVRIKRYDGDGNWVPVGGGSVRDSTSTNIARGQRPALSVYDGRLYVMWYEDRNARVAAFDPANASAGWTLVDGGGITQDSTADRGEPALAVVEDTLYAAWITGTLEQMGGTETYMLNDRSVSVAYYNGDDNSPEWTSFDSPSSSTPGSPDLLGHNGYLILSWSNGDAPSVIRAHAYEPGGSWSSIDKGSALNRDSAQSASDPELSVVDGTLHLSWREAVDVSGTSNPSYRVRSSVLSGTVSSPDWDALDKGEMQGMNYDPGDDEPRTTTGIENTALDGQLYLSFSQGPADGGASPAEQLRALAVTGSPAEPAWNFIGDYADQGRTEGLNADPSNDAWDSAVLGHNGSLYVAWREYEDDTGDWSLRVMQGR